MSNRANGMILSQGRPLPIPVISILTILFLWLKCTAVEEAHGILSVVVTIPMTYPTQEL